MQPVQKMNAIAAISFSGLKQTAGNITCLNDSFEEAVHTYVECWDRWAVLIHHCTVQTVVVRWCHFLSNKMSQSFDQLKLLLGTRQWVESRVTGAFFLFFPPNRSSVSWMRRQQICSDCVTLSCQSESKFLRNFDPTLCFNSSLDSKKKTLSLPHQFNLWIS